MTDPFHLIVWISVYSITFAHITLFVSIYIKNKNKIDLLYLIVLLNIFILALIITLSLVLKIDTIRLLINAILSVYITIPLWGYSSFNLDKKYFLAIPLLVIPEAIIDNILIAQNKLPVLYIMRVVFYVLLAVPVFIKKKEKHNKKSPEHTMQATIKITAALFAVFFASLIPFSWKIFVVSNFEPSYTATLFWEVFTLSYQIPGIVYCISRFSKKTAFAQTGISSLTKRENEVAAAICNGYKYEEIAQKMHISLSTVKRHSFNLYRKLGINNNRELMQIFMDTSPKNDTDNP